MIGGDGNDILSFYGTSRSGTIVDWEGGVDLIDLSRANYVNGFGDVEIDQTPDMTATIRFTSDRCGTVKIEVLSDTSFVLTEESFIL